MSEKEPLIYKKMIAVMRKINPIDKTKKNKQQGFMFRGIDDMYNTLHYLLAEEGIIVRPTVLDSWTTTHESKRGGTIFRTVKRMQYDFVAEDGSKFTTIMDGEGMDSGDKSGSKAESICQKYDLIQVFLIPTKDLAEPDRDSYEVKSQSESVRALQNSMIQILRQLYKNGKITEEQALEKKTEIQNIHTYQALSAYEKEFEEWRKQYGD